ncbi:MAG: helix-turn-helix domain-containing protein [Gaiellaceae bacterium]
MPKRSFDELESRVRQDSEVEAALEELSPYEALARSLIRYRIEGGLTQTQLAEMCGMHQSAIARLESGEHEPKLDTLRRIAQALGAGLVVQLDFAEGRKEELAAF